MIPVSRTTRTSEGLRSTLFDTLDDFMSGKVDAEHAKTVAKLADSLLKSVAVDLEHKKLHREILRVEGNRAVANMDLNIVMVQGVATTNAVPIPMPEQL